MKEETQKTESILDKLGISFHRTLSFKLFTIGILVLLLLIPKFMILSLIQERSTNAKAARLEVTSKWSNNQIITGPVLTIPYKKQVYNEDNEKYADLVETATFLPENLHINGEIHPKKLYRSIYDVVVYQADINISGTFEKPDFSTFNISPENILWEEAVVQFSINDLRGINREVIMNWSGQKLPFSPGMSKAQSGENGISVQIPRLTGNKKNDFSLTLDLKGSNSLLFTPLGKNTEVELQSAWNDPGFTGNFLPVQRTVSQSGFKAKWNVLHFNRNFPQQWTNGPKSGGIPSSVLHESDFGVELVSTANHYQKNIRSTKYALLIIIITFVVFFMYEVFTKQGIHPFQYIMVGSAITLFYLLLLSVTEHLGFNPAYLIASFTVLLLVFFYSRTFMPKLKNSAGVVLALSACFGFVFILLQLETFALLAGSIGLFVLLAALMYTTRKVNWYKG